MKQKIFNDKKIDFLKNKIEQTFFEVGIYVEHEKILELAKAQGAQVDFDTFIMKVPKDVLWKVLSTIPSSFFLQNMFGETYNMCNDCEKTKILGIVLDPYIIDYQTGEHRRPVMEDLYTNIAIVNSDDRFCYSSLMVMELDDYKGKQSIYKALECFLHNHSKAYQVMPDNIEYLETYLELMQIILGSKPLKGSNICTVAIPTLSPLSIKRINCEILIRACEYELPIVTTTCPMAGTTAPYSRDSIILELLVESLAVGFLSQLLNKGNPFMLTGGTSTSNLMTGHDMYYTMEKFQTKMVIAQVGQNLNIPTVTECGGNMTGRYDMQSGAENMLMMLSGFMSGGILAGVGSAYNANGLSAENILIGLSFLDAVKYITDELTLDNLDECIESFKKQGHGGDFLTDDLTLQNIRSNEFFQNELFDYFAEFKKEKSMLEKAHEKAISIRNNFESKVPEKTKYELSKYIKKKIGSL